MAACKRLKTEADYQQWQDLECQPARHDVLMPTVLSGFICLLCIERVRIQIDWRCERCCV